MYGNPDEIDRLADRILRDAQEMRAAAAGHVARGATAEWVSDAADSFRRVIARDAGDVEAAADRLDHAADALRSYAETVRERVAEIKRIEHAVRHWFTVELRKARTFVEHVVDDAGEVIERVTHTPPPWEGWPIGPAHLPEPGDKEWLEVARFMRSMGVPV